MPRLVLKNISQMDIYVPTPNGAGRRVPPGKCIEGNFFDNLIKFTNFALVSATTVPEEDIICNYQTITLDLMTQKEKVLEEKGPELSEEKLQEIQLQKDKDFPTKKHKELTKFNLVELKATADAAGIVYDDKITRRQLINAIVAHESKEKEPKEK